VNNTDFLTIGTFSLRFAIALVFGSLIGLERQWRQRMAGTRTNALVSAGAAAFVMSGFLIHGDLSGQARIVSYVVSGVGFLGAGVIFKENLQVRGLNTAATIWCSASVGVIAGLGYPNYAAVVMLGVLITNTILRPLAYRLHPPSIPPMAPEEANYQLEFICRSTDESHMRALLLQIVGRFPLILYALRSEDRPRGVLVDADLRLLGRNDELLEQIVSRLCLEDGVSSISWHLLPPSDVHSDRSEFVTTEDN
jgi:putative Mg2+ transporter-C (MgtC) family protein